MTLRQIASRAKQRVRLFVHPAVKSTASNLRPMGNMRDVFASPEIAATWKQDVSEIAAVYGDRAIGYGVNPGDRRALYYLVRSLQPRRILETGTHIGVSTMALGKAAARHDGCVTTVDILDVNAPDADWKRYGLKRPPMELAGLLGCPVTFHRGTAFDFMRTTTARFDFIFLDGDHTPAGVYKEILFAMKLLAPGGLIVLHDYHEGVDSLGSGDDLIEGPYLAARRIQIEMPDVLIVPLGELPWPTKRTGRGDHWTSLAAVVHSR